MSGQPERPEAVTLWTEKAEHNFIAAEHLFELPEHELTDIVCFHCQQCAEKYLKAYMVWAHIDIPKTHDLRLLWDLVPKELSSELDREQVIPLNRYAIEDHDPSDEEPITGTDAKHALEMAQAIRRAVLEKLP